MAHLIDPFTADTRIAYFTMEIALRPEIHTYSGGLGVLAGDIAKSCADLRMPVVFVSLASRKGYLRQEIDDAGRQVDHSDPWELEEWASPLDVMVAIELENRPVWIRPWLYVVTSRWGNRLPVILLDTNIEQNSPADRETTDMLYGGDQVYRLRQEAVLGIGGVRILQALGFDIHTYHLNEGHAALLTLELLRRHRRSVQSPAGEPLYVREAVLKNCIFTTHTPVEAAQDRFSYEMFAGVLGDFIELEELKRYAGSSTCNMTQLALNLSGFVNGVSRRDAETTRQLFPGYSVRAITNGVHTESWAHPAFVRIFDAHFPHWFHDPEILAAADRLPDDEIWTAHTQAKADLIGFIKERTGTGFDPNAPLIGFSRRMTGYKRPELLLTDMERLASIAAKQPFQVVWAGKAHPRDSEGKRLIEDIHSCMRQLAGKIPMAFLQNYDLELASRLVSGADIWLNTPLPPLEASGTSGMKAAINGVLNLSVLDGWWIEGCIEGVTGWAIGGDNPSKETEHATDLYQKLEQSVLLLYYRNRPAWIWMMKQSIAKIAAHFSSHRVMRRYAAEAYLH